MTALVTKKKSASLTRSAPVSKLGARGGRPVVLLDIEAGPEVPAELGAGLDGPGAPLQGQGVDDP